MKRRPRPREQDERLGRAVLAAGGRMVPAPPEGARKALGNIAHMAQCEATQVPETLGIAESFRLAADWLHSLCKEQEGEAIREVAGE